MMEYEIRVLLPGGDEIVGDSVEYLAIYSRLNETSVIVNITLNRSTHVMNGARSPNLLPKRVRNRVLKSVWVDRRS